MRKQTGLQVDVETHQKIRFVSKLWGLSTKSLLAMVANDLVNLASKDKKYERNIIREKVIREKVIKEKEIET